MAHWVIVTLVLGVVTLLILASALHAYMDTVRRRAALEAIKAACQAGRDPPQDLIDQVTTRHGGHHMGQRGGHGDPWRAIVHQLTMAVFFGLFAYGCHLYLKEPVLVFTFASVAAGMCFVALVSAVYEALRGSKGQG
jgi:hypothetical protein